MKTSQRSSPGFTADLRATAAGTGGLIMAAGPRLLGALLSVGLSVFVSADQPTIRPHRGETVVLPCGLTRRDPVIVVQWSRTDLGSDYVLLYRDQQVDPFNQHQSFKDRVDLQDRQMKDGDVSLVLKNVTTDDSGTYECRVVQSGTSRKKNLISTIHLEVAPPSPAHFEKQTGDQAVQLGREKDEENKDTGDQDGGIQETSTSAGSQAEGTTDGGNAVWEVQEVVHVEALKVGRAEPSRTAGNQDGENKPGSRTVPGVAASLSCVALVVVAVFALTFWKKRRSDPPPDKVPSDLI
ncbi:hypothetical protein AMECASPLE_005516 [Ameca splendens]|uniref:Ig-like domain-containing protein n=1 Tax=Ameca splendens TaxID=208324 RepID=A0ABV0XZ62_9TELE